MNVSKSNSEPAIEVGVIMRCIALTLALALAGVTFVHVKNQQHALGVDTRKVEQELRDLRAVNQVLRAEITTLSSHARLSSMVAEGNVGLVPISGQFVARLDPPAQTLETGELRTASAASAGDFTP